MYPKRTNMAAGDSQKSQNIGYQKSKIPVLSRGCKRVMKDVKVKREKIEKLEAECEVLKAEIKSKTEPGISVSRATKTAAAGASRI